MGPMSVRDGSKSAWHLAQRAAGRATRRLRSVDAHVPPAVTDDLRSWCDAHSSATYEVIAPAERIVREPPHTIEPATDDVFDQYFVADAPEHAVVGVDGGRIARNGLVFLPDGSLVGDSVTSAREHRAEILAHEPAYARPLPSTVRELPGSWCSLVIGNPQNYYHWQQDVAIRLVSVLPHLPSDVRFVVPAGLPDVHVAMLSAVGLGDAERLEHHGDELWACERLHFASPYLKPMLHTARFMRPFVDRCFDTLAISEKTPRTRILISRARTTHWRATNEDAVMEVLEPHGFERRELSDLTFRQQVELFASAEVVVGTGAGLSNIVFAPRGAKILQFQDPSYPVGHHFTISAAMGHEYWYFLCEPVPNPGSRHGRADIHVPLEKLRQSLDEMLR